MSVRPVVYMSRCHSLIVSFEWEALRACIYKKGADDLGYGLRCERNGFDYLAAMCASEGGWTGSVEAVTHVWPCCVPADAVEAS